MDMPISPDILWRAALAGIPVAILVWVLCRTLPLRAPTRHSLWAVALATFLIGPFLSLFPARELVVDSAGRARELAASFWDVEQDAQGSPAPAHEPRTPAASASPAPLPSLEPSRSPDALTRSSRSDALAKLPYAPRQANSAATELMGPPILLAGPSMPAAPLKTASPRTQELRTSSVHDMPRQLFERRVSFDRDSNPTLPLAATLGLTNPEPMPRTEHRQALITPAPAATPATATPSLHAISPVPAGPTASARLAETWNHLRGAIESLPAIPGRLWIGGAAVLILIMALQIAVCRLRLRGSFEAPAAVSELVSATARTMRLRRTPEVRMVPQRVSPMIWCGLRTRLILPAELWDELDDVGRRAVINHELAHLKRRDHWLCWLELAACILYWWHPIVWWVRHRLREEADLCCDAWVTALMPESRRSYAQALLNTQRFLGGQHVAPPATGLGVLSGGAKRFARRLSMVMTHRATPHRSIAGIALAAFVAAAGLSSAALACPEKDKQAKADRGAGRIEVVLQPETPRAPSAPKPPKAVKAPKAPKVPTVVRMQDGEVVVLSETQAGSTHEQRVRSKNKQSITAEQAAKERVQVRSLQPSRAPRAEVRSWSGTPQAEAGAVYLRRAEEARARGGDGTERRLDSLERRLDGLESRLDRILNQLERRGDAGQHEHDHDHDRASASGIAEGNARVYTLRSGLVDDVYELMARQDVPVLISREGDSIIVHGDGKTQEIVGDFFRIISPDTQQKRAHAAEELRAKALIAAESGRNTLQLREGQLKQLRESLSTQSKERRKAVGHLERQSNAMHRQAEALARQAERAARSAEKQSGASAAEARRQIEAMEAEIEALQRAAEELQQQAEEIADEIEDELSDAMEEIEEQLAELEDLELSDLDFEFEPFDVEVMTEPVEFAPVFAFPEAGTPACESACPPKGECTSAAPKAPSPAAAVAPAPPAPPAAPTPVVAPMPAAAPAPAVAPAPPAPPAPPAGAIAKKN